MFEAPHIVQAVPDSPEVALFRAVVALAVEDARHPELRDRRKAIAWATSPLHAEAFAEVCGYADVNPDAVRKKILAEAALGPREVVSRPREIPPEELARRREAGRKRQAKYRKETKGRRRFHLVQGGRS